MQMRIYCGIISMYMTALKKLYKYLETKGFKNIAKIYEKRLSTLEHLNNFIRDLENMSYIEKVVRIIK